jgi:hypothetical protein
LLVPVWLAFQALAAGETCPSSLDVEARVRTILHLRAEQELSESFLVERHEAGLYVELRAADSSSIGQRTLPTEGSCDELAQAAAVVLSAWLSDVHPDFASALPAPDRQPEPQPGPEPQPELPPPTPARSVEITSPPAPASPASPVTPRGWDIALGIGGDYASQPALAGFLGVGYIAKQRGFGLSGMLLPMLARQEPLDPGNFTWRRWPLGVGPSFQLAPTGVAVDLNLGPALAWLHFEGDLFQHNHRRDGFSWGGFLNARVTSLGSRWGVFALVDAQLYPKQSRVYATLVSDQWTVPPFSLAVVVGARLSP